MLGTNCAAPAARAATFKRFRDRPALIELLLMASAISYGNWRSVRAHRAAPAARAAKPISSSTDKSELVSANWDSSTVGYARISSKMQALKSYQLNQWPRPRQFCQAISQLRLVQVDHDI